MSVAASPVYVRARNILSANGIINLRQALYRNGLNLDHLLACPVA